MKIGIQTYPKNNNYGWILQLYALKKQLERMGHDVTVIDKRDSIIRNKYLYPALIIKRIIKKWIQRKADVTIFYEKSILRKNETEGLFLNYFFCKYITPRTKILSTRKDLTDLNSSDLDAIIVGSDQVWRSRFFQEIDLNFLSYITNPKIKKISYAASFGVDSKEYSENEIKACGKAISSFKGISVREKSGIELIKKIYKWDCIEPVHSIDPTFFLSPNDYNKLIEDGYTKKVDGELFCYILDKTDDKEECIKKIKNKFSYRPYTINLENTLPPVEQWIRSFKDAQFIFTDSFHGCVFSIIFKKPFIVYGNKERGLARFISLLEKFGLESHLITNNEQIDMEKMADFKIDHVSDIINKERLAGIHFIQDTLS